MPDIGATLRETRMARRLDITEVEAATKIRAKYLRALENEEWDQLPGPTFVRTFLRTYGDYLELDSRMLVEEYKQRFQRPAPQDLLPFGSGSTSRRQPRARALPPFAIVGVVVVLLFAALFALGTLGGGDGGGRDASTAVTPAPTGSPSARSSAAERRRRERERRRKAAAAKPSTVSLRIVPTGDVNVCLVSGTTGRVLIDSQTLSAGNPTRTYRAKRLKLTLGNAQATMRVDGKTVPVAQSDQAIGYDLRAGRTPRRLPAGQLPTCS